jgi:hypothetical protein
MGEKGMETQPANVGPLAFLGGDSTGGGDGGATPGLSGSSAQSPRDGDEGSTAFAEAVHSPRDGDGGAGAEGLASINQPIQSPRDLPGSADSPRDGDGGAGASS